MLHLNDPRCDVGEHKHVLVVVGLCDDFELLGFEEFFEAIELFNLTIFYHLQVEYILGSLFFWGNYGRLGLWGGFLANIINKNNLYLSFRNLCFHIMLQLNLLNTNTYPPLNKRITNPSLTLVCAISNVIGVNVRLYTTSNTIMNIQIVSIEIDIIILVISILTV